MIETKIMIPKMVIATEDEMKIDSIPKPSQYTDIAPPIQATKNLIIVAIVGHFMALAP